MSLRSQIEKATYAPGHILDERFLIEEYLGAGSFGEVYRAKQLVFGHVLREVALKLFAAENIKASNYHEIFADALTLISLLEDDPPANVSSRMIQVFDVGIIESPSPQAYMTMKLVRGGRTLEQPVRRFKHEMPVSLCLGYLCQLLTPLAWMHTLPSPVIHGDLKPDNILLSEDLKHITLTDFGLATRVQIAYQGGAIAYQSPEQLLGVSFGTAADVYAIGLLWYEMLVGKNPFAHVGAKANADGDSRAYVQDHQKARRWKLRASGQVSDLEFLQPPSEVNEEMKRHPQLERVLARCLAYEQHHRYGNAREVLEDIRSYSETGRINISFDDADDEDSSPEAIDDGREKTPNQLLGDALVHVENQQFELALRLVQRAIRIHPGYFVAGELARVRILSRTGELNEAYQTAMKIREHVPNEPEVLDAMVDVAERMQNPSLADRFRKDAAKMRNRLAAKRRRT